MLRGIPGALCHSFKPVASKLFSVKSQDLGCMGHRVFFTTVYSVIVQRQS